MGWYNPWPLQLLPVTSSDGSASLLLLPLVLRQLLQPHLKGSLAFVKELESESMLTLMHVAALRFAWLLFWGVSCDLSDSRLHHHILCSLLRAFQT